MINRKGQGRIKNTLYMLDEVWNALNKAAEKKGWSRNQYVERLLQAKFKMKDNGKP